MSQPTFNSYPSDTPKALDDVFRHLEQIERERKTDIVVISNLINQFISGRKVGKLPLGSADVSPTDRIGDVNYDLDYFYILVDDTLGGAVWRRIALGAW